jgi:chaperonin GroEL (HSP60 family)
MNMFAKAMEIIPRTIADNAGLDSLDLINKLRNRHRTFRVTQTREDPKISTRVSTSTKALLTTRTLSSGSPFL